MLNFLLYLPLLVFQFNIQEGTVYSWQSNKLCFQSSSQLVVGEDQEDFWSLVDTSFSFWMFCDRISFSECEPELLEAGSEKGAFRLAKLYHYKKVKKGGRLSHFDQGHYVVCKQDGETHYVIFIIDRLEKFVYQINIENSFEDDTKAMEVINSLSYYSDK